MPLFDPPENLTAAQSLLLLKQGAKVDDLTIANLSIIQMIQRKFLQITKTTKKKFFLTKEIYTIKLTGKEPSNFEERLYVKCLGSRPLVLDGKVDTRVEHFCRSINKKVSKSMEKKYYQMHSKKLLKTSIPFSYLLFYFMIHDPIEALMREPKIILVPALLAYLISLIRRKWTALITTGCLVYFSISFFLLNSRLPTIERFMDFFLVLTLALFPLFSFLLYQPSEKGQRLYEHLLGLKMFIKATHRPTREEALLSKEKLEELFPYAMALNLEKEWERKFKRLFGEANLREFHHTHFYTNIPIRRALASSSPRSSGSGFGGGGAGGGGGGGGGGGR